jgi:hypothetical protein
VVHRCKPNVKFSFRDAARRGHRLSGANRVPIGNRSSCFRAPLNHFSSLHLDYQKDLVANKRSSVFDHLEWPELGQQLNVQRNSRIRNKEVVLPLGSMPSNYSRSGIQIQDSKGKKLVIHVESQNPSLVPIYGK